ncbi:hypothetical protein [Nonlabens antarcticus]|uniref:hypothetical protein n=1 Tax=Nonlabens antarcticus TaxID=392714 RepID=UPI0018918790|nr:hypothetical protein [Nonlabens antarcticus]
MKKIILYVFLGLTVVTVGGYFYVNHLVKQKVETFLADQLSPQINFTYGGIYMSTFSGLISIEGIDARFSNKNDTVIHTRATVDKLELSGFAYWNYFVNDQIQFDHIEINENNIVYFKDKFIKAQKSNSDKQDPLAKIDKSVLVSSLSIGNTSFTMYDASKDSVVLHISKAALSMKDIRTDASIIKQRIPITYDQISLASDSLFLKISPYEDLNIKSLNIADDAVTIKDLSILPKYSKQEYSRILPKERDYTVLKIPSINIMGYEFGFNQENLFFNVQKVEVDKPDLSIYRDKLVADDLSVKPLYSKMLRDLKMQLMVDSILISKSHIVYEEKVKSDKSAGSIEFTDLNLDMAAVGNVQEKGRLTSITADGLFQESNIHVDWSFDVHNVNDAFRFSGNIGKLPASNINSFVRPNLNVEFEGTLEEIYFDISGNNNTSQTAMKMAYDDFKVNLMRKNNSGVNKFLSGIANLFVAKDSKDDGEKYRDGNGNAERNKDQSVFNFVWISILSALLKTMT